MGLAENVSALASRVATEFNTIRSTLAPLASPTFTGTVTVPYPSNVTDAASKQYAFDVANATNQGAFAPSDHGLLTWTYDPVDIQSSLQPGGNGWFFATAIKVDFTVTCTGVATYIFTAGATLTASRNYLGLYSTTGTLLRQTADQTTNWTTANVTRNAAWSAGTISLSPGIYFVGGIATGTTRPAFAAKAILNANGANTPSAYGRSGGLWRTYGGNTTLTAMPASLPAAALFSNAVWFGLY